MNRSISLLLVLLLTGGLMAGCRRDGGSARVSRVPIIRDKEISDLSRQLQAKPGDQAVLMKMAARYTEIGMEAEAEASYEKILKADPYNEEARGALSGMLVEKALRSAALSKEDQASEFLDKAQKLGLDAAALGRARAQVAMKRYNTLKAAGQKIDLALVKKALEADPACSEAHQALIESALDSKDIIGAAEAAAAALRALPQDGQILKLAASVDLAAGNLESATRLLERAAKEDPQAQTEVTALLADRGRELLAQKRFQEAIEVFSRAREKDNALAVDLARAYLGAGNLKSARAAAQEAVALNPSDENSHFVLGDVLAAGQDTEGAMKAYQAVLEFHPESLEPHFRRARLLSRLNRLQEAIEELQKALAKEPGHIQAAEQMGILYARAENYEKAQEIWEKILAAKPDYANVYYDMALLKMKKRDFDEAIVNYSRASQLDPSNPLYLYSLGLAYRQKGLIDESIEAWKGVLSVAPDSKYAQVVREMIGPETARKGQEDFDDLQRLVNYALICEKSGKRAEAFKSYARALTMSPMNSRVNRAIYPHYIEAGDHLQALASILVARATGDRSRELQDAAGEEYLACGMIRKGMSILNRGLEVGDIDRNQEINAMVSLAGVLEKRGAYSLAAAHLLEAAAMDSRYDLMIKAGEQYILAEEYDSALGTFNRVAESGAESDLRVAALVKAGAIGGLRGDMNQACKYFDRALELDPKNFSAYLSYGEALRKGRMQNEAIMVYQRLLTLLPPPQVEAQAREILSELGSGAQQSSSALEAPVKTLPQWDNE